jgi:hypothetical protein
LVAKSSENEDVFWNIEKKQLLLKANLYDLKYKDKYCNYINSDDSLICRVSPPPENKFKKLQFLSDPLSPSFPQKYKLSTLYLNFQG